MAPMSAEPGDVMFFDLSQSLTMRQSAPDGLVDWVTLWTVRDRILPLVSDENALHGLVLKRRLAGGSGHRRDHAGVRRVGAEDAADRV